MLRQKKQYERQVDNLRNQSFNMEHLNMTTKTLKDTVNAAIFASQDTSLQHDDNADEETKPKSKFHVPRVNGQSEGIQTDNSRARQFWGNILVNWQERKAGLLRRMRPTKSFILNGSPSPNTVGKSGSGKDTRQSAA